MLRLFCGSVFIAIVSNKAGEQKPKQNIENMKKNKKQTVKILGYTVTVGSKKHAELVAQVKHFNSFDPRSV